MVDCPVWITGAVTDDFSESAQGTVVEFGCVISHTLLNGDGGNNCVEFKSWRIQKAQLDLFQVQEDVSKNLTVMKNTLACATPGDSHAEMQVSQLGQEVYSSHLLLLLVQNLSKIDFEGRKDAVHIFNNVLHRQIGTRLPTVEYLYLKPQILFLLLSGYETPDVALNCGAMLRECIKHEDLAKVSADSFSGKNDLLFRKIVGQSGLRPSLREEYIWKRRSWV